ncbi:MAG: 1-deoxy-D-xylulose-5-phosphate synthase [Candidatus Omnitrophica bacterium]|nr:1-deoxy-D-xylulose-5-phosphate synthase [Candidatus Omnitrophota bacterium]
MSLLEIILKPQDLKRLTPEQLPLLATEVRQRIIEIVSKNGGHLASSLGAVDLIIALHYCLDMEKDKVIFDVGHQAYAHKILTGRNKDFALLRQYGGISGFPCKEESVHDPFTTGHSSTAVSLALGLSCAQDYLPNEERFKVVAVIGDGSLSGGLCFEGLNNAGHLKRDLLIVLNTNELSIAANAGALSTYINKIISLPIYNRFKSSLENFVTSRLPKGSRLIKIANKFEEQLKGLFVPGILFEELGFRYFGPFNGHDLSSLIKVLKNILSINGPKLFHVITQKGRGYPPAEKEPVRFHGTGPFDIATGRVSSLSTGSKTFTEIFSSALLEEAEKDRRIVAITAAMPDGTGLDKFRDKYPERFFDVGIAEAHAVCFAAGLAKGSLRPVVAIYSTFLQRAYDQVAQDLALQDLPVVLAIDRAGIVGEDGATHQGIFDIAYLRSVPNICIMAPKNGQELKLMLKFAIDFNRPVALRYPKASVYAEDLPILPIELGKGELLSTGNDFCVLALGSMVPVALEAIGLLQKEGISGTLVNARFVKPLDENFIKSVCAGKKYIFTIEEGILEGGFGSAVADLLNRPVVKIGLPCAFIPHGKRDILLDKYGLSAQAICSKIKARLWAR